jgi:bis(5'-adenosyl)-triphosphatase
VLTGVLLDLRGGSADRAALRLPFDGAPGIAYNGELTGGTAPTICSLPQCADLSALAMQLLDCPRPSVLEPGHHAFGRFVIPPGQIFHESLHAIALVNIKPVLRGHVLVISRRPCPRFTWLTDEEVAGLWCTARTVGAALEAHYSGTALTLSIQDGPDAGQSVPHVHVHVLPREPADLPDNDAIYGQMEEASRQAAVALDPQARTGSAFAGRVTVARTEEDMAAEADTYRALLAGASMGVQ